jgi:hypothetical protein
MNNKTLMIDMIRTKKHDVKLVELPSHKVFGDTEKTMANLIKWKNLVIVTDESALSLELRLKLYQYDGPMILFFHGGNNVRICDKPYTTRTMTLLIDTLFDNPEDIYGYMNSECPVCLEQTKDLMTCPQCAYMNCSDCYNKCDLICPACRFDNHSGINYVVNYNN